MQNSNHTNLKAESRRSASVFNTKLYLFVRLLLVELLFDWMFLISNEHENDAKTSFN